MTIWGNTTDGKAVSIFTLKGGNIEVRVMAYGANLVSVKAPDRHGKIADVVLGYDDLATYLKSPNPYIGGLIGRFGNRIDSGKFTLGGKAYQILQNEGSNALHGGPIGFDKHLWAAAEVPGGVEFTHVSPDGDMGFPGTLTAKVKYTVSGNTLRIDYSATTDKETVVNLTNHAYFNLRGNDDGNILGHKVQLSADHYTPVNSNLIPTGEVAPVAGTPLDFRTPHVVADRIEDKFEQMVLGHGYDHNFKVNGAPGTLRHAATVVEPESGRTLTVETTEPAIQFYSGNFLDGAFTGRHGKAYARRTGFCLETQHFPDAPNHPEFLSTTLKPGETMHSTTTFTFGVE
jgi:aldose 1-epimerase